MAVGLGNVIVARGSEVIGDMVAEEGGVVMLEEESMTTTDLARGKGARWTEMSTAGGDAATIAREAGSAT